MYWGSPGTGISKSFNFEPIYKFSERKRKISKILASFNEKK